MAIKGLNLLCQLLLAYVTSPLSLNVVCFSDFELTVGTAVTAQTDGQTDGM